MIQHTVIKRIFYLTGIFIILGFCRSVFAVDLWPTKPSKYYEEYIKADAEYNKQVHARTNMSPEEKKQLQSEVFAKADKTYQEESIALAKRIKSVVSDSWKQLDLKDLKNIFLKKVFPKKDRNLASSKSEPAVPEPVKAKKSVTDQRNTSTSGGGPVVGGGAEGISFKGGSENSPSSSPSQPSGGSVGGAEPISFK